jgi:hypothetical protein
MNISSGSYAIAFGLPLNEAIRKLEASANDLERSSEKVSAERSQSSFGQRIKRAVQAKLPHRDTGNTAKAERESFGRKIANAARAKAKGRKLTMTR